MHKRVPRTLQWGRGRERTQDGFGICNLLCNPSLQLSILQDRVGHLLRAYGALDLYCEPDASKDISTHDCVSSLSTDRQQWQGVRGQTCEVLTWPQASPVGAGATAANRGEPGSIAGRAFGCPGVLRRAASFSGATGAGFEDGEAARGVATGARVGGGFSGAS